MRDIKETTITVPLDSLPLRRCVCGEDRFLPTIHLREVSALLALNGQAGVVLTDGGFICATCGLEADLSAKEGKKKEDTEKKLVGCDNVQ